MPKLTEYKLKDPIYGAEIILLIGGSVADLKKRTGEDDLDESAGGYMVQTGEGFDAVHYVWSKNLDIPVICHELLHLTFAVLLDRGFSLSEDSEEAFTYWFETILEQVIKKTSAAV